METMKNFVLSLILVCFFLQVGSIFLASEKYKKIYNLISATLIISMILKIPVKKPELNIDIKESDYETYDFDVNAVKIKFLDELGIKIEDDIYSKFDVLSEVDAETNLESITLDILIRSDDANIDEISKYIRNNYCTENDEVYIRYEPNY